MDSNKEAPRIEPSSSRTTWTKGSVELSDAVSSSLYLTAAFYVVNGWVAGGFWDEITSDEMDHSRKFPGQFSTRMLGAGNAQSNSLRLFFTGHISAGFGT